MQGGSLRGAVPACCRCHGSAAGAAAKAGACSTVPSSLLPCLRPAAAQPVFFDPRALTNLELLDRLDSLAPITDMKVGRRAGRWSGRQPVL